MNRSQHTDIGTVKTTKAEFEDLGEDAWWMHQTCMASEDVDAYYGSDDDDDKDDDSKAEEKEGKGNKEKKEKEKKQFAWE